MVFDCLCKNRGNNNTTNNNSHPPNTNHNSHNTHTSINNNKIVINDEKDIELDEKQSHLPLNMNSSDSSVSANASSTTATIITTDTNHIQNNKSSATSFTPTVDIMTSVSSTNIDSNHRHSHNHRNYFITDDFQFRIQYFDFFKHYLDLMDIAHRCMHQSEQTLFPELLLPHTEIQCVVAVLHENNGQRDEKKEIENDRLPIYNKIIGYAIFYPHSNCRPYPDSVWMIGWLCADHQRIKSSKSQYFVIEALVRKSFQTINSHLTDAMPMMSVGLKHKLIEYQHYSGYHTQLYPNTHLKSVNETDDISAVEQQSSKMSPKSSTAADTHHQNKERGKGVGIYAPVYHKQAQQMYEKLGFDKIAKISNYYTSDNYAQNATDAYLYCKGDLSHCRLLLGMEFVCYKKWPQPKTSNIMADEEMQNNAKITNDFPNKSSKLLPIAVSLTLNPKKSKSTNRRIIGMSIENTNTVQTINHTKTAVAEKSIKKKINAMKDISVANTAKKSYGPKISEEYLHVRLAALQKEKYRARQKRAQLAKEKQRNLQKHSSKYKEKGAKVDKNKKRLQKSDKKNINISQKIQKKEKLSKDVKRMTPIVRTDRNIPQIESGSGYPALPALKVHHQQRFPRHRRHEQQQTQLSPAQLPLQMQSHHQQMSDYNYVDGGRVHQQSGDYVYDQQPHTMFYESVQMNSGSPEQQQPQPQRYSEQQQHVYYYDSRQIVPDTHFAEYETPANAHTQQTSLQVHDQRYTPPMQMVNNSYVHSHTNSRGIVNANVHMGMNMNDMNQVSKPTFGSVTPTPTVNHNSSYYHSSVPHHTSNASTVTKTFSHYGGHNHARLQPWSGGYGYDIGMGAPSHDTYHSYAVQSQQSHHQSQQPQGHVHNNHPYVSQGQHSNHRHAHSGRQRRIGHGVNVSGSRDGSSSNVSHHKRGQRSGNVNHSKRNKRYTK